jgi:hypothetical protein
LREIPDLTRQVQNDEIKNAQRVRDVERLKPVEISCKGEKARVSQETVLVFSPEFAVININHGSYSRRHHMRKEEHSNQEKEKANAPS